MKTLVNRLVLFSAGALVFGSMAYGQTQMKAEIPFAFHTAGATLPAGNYLMYRESNISGVPMGLRFYNTASHQSVFVMSNPLDTEKPGTPSLKFVCDGEGCSLSALRTSSGTFTYRAPHNSARQNEAVSVMPIPVRAAVGE